MSKEPLPDLYELVKQASSKASFLHFLDALIADWYDSQEKEKLSPASPYGPKANDWENYDIGRFLEAMRDWSNATSGATDEPFVPEEPSWQTFANMFTAAKIYE